MKDEDDRPAKGLVIEERVNVEMTKISITLVIYVVLTIDDIKTAGSSIRYKLLSPT